MHTGAVQANITTVAVTS